MIYEFKLPAGMRKLAKKPYDKNHHEALVHTIEMMKHDLKRNAPEISIKILITDQTIYINDGDFPPRLLLAMVSWLTSAVSLALRPLSFDINTIVEIDFTAVQKNIIQKYSKATYELYLENPEFKEPSLFAYVPDVTYEKTPAYFREGIIV